MSLTYVELLRDNRNFRNLFWGQIISELGNWFYFLAALGLVRVITDASTEIAGTLLLLRTLPFALLMPLAGTLADRISRKKMMFYTDISRGFASLIFLLVHTRDDLWIAFMGTVILSSSAALFDGAKNAATPNVAGKDGLLAGTALMFSTRFLLMAVGAALGGVAVLYFSYQSAFVINSISFFASAFTVWLIPEDSMIESEAKKREKESFVTELREGLQYTKTNRLAFTILIMNIVWATGGGAIMVVFEGLSTMVYNRNGYSSDAVYAILLCANGIGLTAGMFIARGVDGYVHRKKIVHQFIVIALITHGLLFAIIGYMPTVWISAFVLIISRVIIGAEYAVQETIFQRSLPDSIRGRITTLDRGAEITSWSIATHFSGKYMAMLTAPLTGLFSGVLSGAAGFVWLWYALRADEEKPVTQE